MVLAEDAALIMSLLGTMSEAQPENASEMTEDDEMRLMLLDRVEA